MIGFAVLAARARHCPAPLFQAPYQMAEVLSLRRLGAPRVFPTALGMPLFPPEFLGVFHDLIAEQTGLSQLSALGQLSPPIKRRVQPQPKHGIPKLAVEVSTSRTARQEQELQAQRQTQ